MANVIRRAGPPHPYLTSVHTPAYPTVAWLHNPDTSAVSGVDPKYWKVVGDAVLEMTPAEKAAVDAASQTSTDDTTMTEFDARDAIAALALTVLDEFNLHAARVNELLDAIDAATSLGDIKTAVAAMADLPTRTVPQLKTAIRTRLEAING